MQANNSKQKGLNTVSKKACLDDKPKNWANRIIVLNVEATVASAHGVWGCSVVRRWMMVVIVRAVEPTWLHDFHSSLTFWCAHLVLSVVHSYDCDVTATGNKHVHFSASLLALSSFICIFLFCLSVSVKWLAVKTASEMTYIVSIGALNSTPTNQPRACTRLQPITMQELVWAWSTSCGVIDVLLFLHVSVN